MNSAIFSHQNLGFTLGGFWPIAIYDIQSIYKRNAYRIDKHKQLYDDTHGENTHIIHILCMYITIYIYIVIKSWPYDKLQYGDLILDHATVAMVVETNPRYYLDVDLMQSLGPCKEVGPPNDSVQLVQITPITMIYGTYNYSYIMVFINHLTSLGGPTL